MKPEREGPLVSIRFWDLCGSSLGGGQVAPAVCYEVGDIGNEVVGVGGGNHNLVPRGKTGSELGGQAQGGLLACL